MHLLHACRRIRLLRHEDILSFDEITGVARIAVEMGVRKIRITGENRWSVAASLTS